MPERRWLLTPLLLAAACAGASADPRRASVDELPPGAESPAERAAALAEADAAVDAYRETRTDDAVRLVAAALDRDPRCGRALAVQALVRWRQAQAEAMPPPLHDTNAAEAALRQALAAAPDDAFAGLALATFLGDVGHLSAAAEAAEAALARASAPARADRADLLATAAACRFELGEERAALPHLQAAIALQPDDAALHYRLGSALLAIAATPQDREPTSLLTAQRQAEAAARAFARCYELTPTDVGAGLAIPAASLRAADLAADRGAAADERLALVAAATDQARAVAVRFPAAAEPWWWLGLAAERAQDAATAANAYDEALARDPEHAGALLNRAALADAAGDGAAAKALLQRALDADAKKPCLDDGERKRARARLAQP
jgi:tetratricopeptide (TPR) repeat protein